MASVFPGATAADTPRLGAQLAAILNVTIDGRWRTMEEIQREVEKRFPDVRCPLPSLSAQLRHLTKPEHGGYVKEREHLGDGLHRYRILPPKRNTQKELWG